MKKLLLFVSALFSMGAAMELNAQTQSGGKILTEL
jgi:hypothetical protein